MITFFLMGLNLYPWSLSPPNCPSLGLALRTGRDSCWVQFRISPHQKICLSRKEWTRWLTAPQELCPHPRGPWKSYHSPRNHSQPDFNQRIQTLQLQHSTSLPIAPDWRTRIRGKIERWREQISIRLAPYDPLGILRSLVLYEGTSRPSLSFLRKLGFVHLVSATGIHLYALASFLEKMTYAGCVFFRIPLFTGLWISRVCSFTLCLSIWILCGARIGMLRPWLVILVRGLARYLGFQWRQFAPLFIALSIEAMIATYYWGTGHIGLAHSGRWIYALAVGGGLMGCEYLGLHLGLAVGSWAGVALWEMRESGILALGTPLLSLITLPVICNGTYPLLILSLGLQAMGLGSASSFILEWIARTLPPFITELTKWAMKTGNLWVVPTEALAAGALFSSLLFIWKPSSRDRKSVV